MKRIVWIMAVFIFVLTGCATQADNPQISEMESNPVKADSPQIQETESIGGDEVGEEAESDGSNEAGEEAVLLQNVETLTEPPMLEVSTQNNVDRVTAACSNWQWSLALPDGTATTVIACGAHPLDWQDHPILYTAFPAGSLPPLEEGENVGSILPVFYLDFGEVLPETVSVIRWQASYIGDTEKYADFEEVMTQTEDGKIVLAPLGDGEFVYEISAHWGEVGDAGYTFRTLPQIRP